METKRLPTVGLPLGFLLLMLLLLLKLFMLLKLLMLMLRGHLGCAC